MSEPFAPAGSTSPGESYVDYEYGDLKEVIVGVPFNIYPDVKIAKWAAEVVKILPKEEADRMWSRSEIRRTTLSRCVRAAPCHRTSRSAIPYSPASKCVSRRNSW